MCTAVYVDGFNVYYGLFGRARQPEPPVLYRWLDVEALVRHVWPALPPIGLIRYFTALVKATPGDASMPVRQQTYLRALRARGVDVQLGAFKFRCRSVALVGAATKPTSPGNIVSLAEGFLGKYDEKGSDVSLASFLVRDAALDLFSDAVVISNDSDLVKPLEIAIGDFGKNVYVLNPQRRPVRELTRAAASSSSVPFSALAACQLPATLADGVGTITKPPSW
jgi:hypothetical protein